MRFEKLKSFQNLTTLKNIPSLGSLNPKQYIFTTKYLSQSEMLLLSAEILCHAKELLDSDFKENQVLIDYSLRTANDIINNLNNYFDHLMTKKEKKVLLRSLQLRIRT